jgi:hypothetical protein
MSKFGDLVSGKAAPAPAPAPTPTPEPVRDDKGHYVADDPSTPENEAWVGGKAPKKK